MARKLDELTASHNKKPNPFVASQIQEFRKILNAIEASKNHDELVSTLLTVDKTTAQKFGLISILRSLVIRKVFLKQHSQEMLNNIVTVLRGGVSAEGVLALVNLLKNIIKDHVLNVQQNNTEGYWLAKTWQDILEAKDNSSRVNLVKIFEPHASRLQQASDKFRVQQTGASSKVIAIPDRGLVGELSAYLANACYSAEYPLLKRYPTMTPYKFVLDDKEDASFFDSVLIFEVTTQSGQKAMLVRALNLPKENSINVTVFIEDYFDKLWAVAKKRGVSVLLVPGISGAIANYSMTINYLSRKYINDQKPISLSEQFTFNNYNITQFCYAVRLSNVTTDEASPQNEKSADGQLVQMAS